MKRISAFGLALIMTCSLAFGSINGVAMAADTGVIALETDENATTVEDFSDVVIDENMGSNTTSEGEGKKEDSYSSTGPEQGDKENGDPSTDASSNPDDSSASGITTDSDDKEAGTPSTGTTSDPDNFSTSDNPTDNNDNEGDTPSTNTPDTPADPTTPDNSDTANNPIEDNNKKGNNGDGNEEKGEGNDGEEPDTSIGPDTPQDETLGTNEHVVDAVTADMTLDANALAIATYGLSFTNTVIGADGESTDDFVFQASCSGATIANDTVTVTGDGSGTFNLSFPAAGTYTVYITCTTGTVGYLIGDDRTMEVALTVSGSTVTETSRSLKLNGSVAGVQTSFVSKYSRGFTWSESTKRQAQKIMDDMTLEEKVGQLFILHYPNDGSGSIADATKLINTYHPGAYLVFAAMFNNNTPDGVRSKVSAAQTASLADSGVPVFFSVDEEGGRVVRISDKSAYGHSKFESQLSMASKGAAAIEADALDKANFLQGLGMNVNHAPVADVSGPGGYMYSRERVYGGDALKVAEYVAASVRGHNAVDNIGTSIKHFPGYGATSSDTHNGFAINDLSRADFDYGDLLPFYEGIAAGSKSVMVTHNIINCMDTDMPASLSSAVIDVLRNDMNFDGVIMTDDLNMGAIIQAVGEGNAALACLQAGVDMPMCADPDKQVPKVIAAVNNGTLPMSRIEESCLRVLSWKIEMGLIEKEVDPEPTGVDKTELTNTISAAVVAQGTVMESADGTDVAIDTKWVTPAEMKALSDAIDDAKVVRDNVDATETDVSAAVDALNAAVAAFNAAKKDGTKLPDAEAEYTNASGNVQYGTFENMWALAVANGGTVRMLQDVNTAGDKTVLTKNVTLNLNGHKLHFTSGTNGFIVNGSTSTSFTVTDSVDPIIQEAVTEDTSEKASYNSVRRELLYYTMAEDGTITRHDVNLDACGGITGDNTGIMIEVKTGVFNLDGGVLTHKVRAVETINNASNVINIRGGAVVGCGVAAGGSTVNGSGVGVYGGGTLNISGGYIAGNEATTRGGGIIIESSGKMNMTGGVLAANRINTNGGAIYANSGTTVNISGGTIANNYAGSQGGGIYVLGANSVMTVSDNTLMTMNSTGGNGGAIFSMAGWGSNQLNTVNVSGGLFTGNMANNGGAIKTGTSANNGGLLNITGGTFNYNSATTNGGAIEATGAVKGVTISNATFQNNSAANGGAIYLNSSATVTMANDEISQNQASSNGGGIYLATGTVKMSDSTIKTNVAGGNGGGVYHNGTAFSLKGDIVIERNRVGASGNNLYLPSGKTVALENTLGYNSSIGITTAVAPTDGSPVPVATATQTAMLNNSLSFFYSDKAGCSPSLQSSKIVLTLGESGTQGPEIKFDGILFQYYADVTFLATTGDDTRRLEIADTSGKNIPVNGQTPVIKYLYLNEDGSVKTTSALTEIYKARDLRKSELTSLQGLNKFSTEEGFYEVTEVWVLKEGGYPGSTTMADWDVYEWTPDLNFTTDPAKVDDNSFFIDTGSVVRYVCSAVNGKYSGTAAFYDYDISDGNLYGNITDASTESNPIAVSEQDTREAAGNNSYFYTYHSGINSDDNYSGTGQRFAFGNANSYTGYGNETRDGYKFNSANRGKEETGKVHFKLCHFGLVEGLDENGHIIYNSEISVPNLFDEGPAIGKTVYSDYKLNFNRRGDQYILSSIGGLEDYASNLEKFGHPGIYTTIWTNDFWPMDGAPSYGTDTHDPKFGHNNIVSQGGDGGKINRYGYSATGNNQQGEMPKSDDAQDHNAYFGMQYAMAFTLTEDYVGPLEYTFFGDDDLWVFLDNQLICDIGGVHQSTGAFVNLRDYLGENDYGDHELRVYYLERGASGSTCWMRFNLPHLRTITDDVVEFPGSLRIEKFVEDSDTTEEFEFTVSLTLNVADGSELSNEFAYSGSKNGTLKSGDSITLAAGEYIVIPNLPIGTQYTVTETAVDGFKILSTGASGTINDGQSTAHFVNQAVGTLRISKKVLPTIGTNEENTYELINIWLDDPEEVGTYMFNDLWKGKGNVRYDHSANAPTYVEEVTSNLVWAPDKTSTDKMDGLPDIIADTDPYLFQPAYYTYSGLVHTLDESMVLNTTGNEGDKIEFFRVDTNNPKGSRLMSK